MNYYLTHDYHIAVPTAFYKDEELNTKDTLEHIVNLKNEGIGSVLVCGSTGEQHSLTLLEKLALVQAIENDHRFDEDFEIIFGLSSIRQKDVITLAKKINNSTKIRGVLLGFPPYILPTQREIVVYINIIAKALDKPIILYNNPRRAGFDLSIPTLLEVMNHTNIIGLKEAGDFTRIPQIKSNVDKSIRIYAGGEIALKEKVAYGCNGLSSIIGNIYPLEIRDWFHALQTNTEQITDFEINIEDEISKIFDPNISTISYLKRMISEREKLDLWTSRAPLGNR